MDHDGAAGQLDPNQLAPFDAKPLLVLTEDAPIQEQVFFSGNSEEPRGCGISGSAQIPATIEAHGPG